jgi:hypothetical protein
VLVGAAFLLKDVQRVFFLSQDSQYYRKLAGVENTDANHAFAAFLAFEEK